MNLSSSSRIHSSTHTPPHQRKNYKARFRSPPRSHGGERREEKWGCLRNYLICGWDDGLSSPIKNPFQILKHCNKTKQVLELSDLFSSNLSRRTQSCLSHVHYKQHYQRWIKKYHISTKLSNSSGTSNKQNHTTERSQMTHLLESRAQWGKPSISNTPLHIPQDNPKALNYTTARTINYTTAKTKVSNL